MSSRRRQTDESLAVLVIEDDADARHIYSEYLRSKRWTVFSAVDGRMGLNKINELRPDVIVLDLAMPRVDGWTVLKNVRESSITADIADRCGLGGDRRARPGVLRRVRCLPHETLPARSAVPPDPCAVALPGRGGAERSLSCSVLDALVDLNCQAGVVRSTIQDEAWAIVLAAANEAERAAELNHVAAFAAPDAAESDVAPLRRVAVGDRDAAIEWRPRSGWELVLPADGFAACADRSLPADLQRDVRASDDRRPPRPEPRRVHRHARRRIPVRHGRGKHPAPAPHARACATRSSSAPARLPPTTRS